MKIENGRYVELTMSELMDLYFNNDWDEVFSINEFKNNFISSGCKIIEKEETKN